MLTVRAAAWDVVRLHHRHTLAVHGQHRRRAEAADAGANHHNLQQPAEAQERSVCTVETGLAAHSPQQGPSDSSGALRERLIERRPSKAASRGVCDRSHLCIMRAISLCSLAG